VDRLRAYLREEREKLKPLSAKARLEYFWDYYKIQTGIASVILVFLISVVASVLTRKESRLHVVMINAVSAENTLFDDWFAQAGYNAKKEEITVTSNWMLDLETGGETDVVTVQAVAALFAARDLDLYISDRAAFDYFAPPGAFTDLREVLGADAVEKLGDRLYYCDTEEYGRIAAGVIFEEGSPLHEAGYYYMPVIAGIAASTEHMDAAVQCLLWLAL